MKQQEILCNNTQATMPAVKQQTRIALVEDDLDLLHSTQEFLTALGFYVWGEPSAEAFFRRFSAEPVDVVVLDIGLPDEDGLSVASLLRANRYLAVIILSARDSLEDRLAGLRAGADRYLVKPINLMELAANIEAVSNRMEPAHNPSPLELPRLASAATPGTADQRWSLTVETWVLTTPAGKTLQLSSREFVLLHKLITSQGQVVSRKDLVKTIFGTRNINGDDRFNVLLTRLRKKVSEMLETELPLKTAHLVGYAFIAQARVI